MYTMFPFVYPMLWISTATDVVMFGPPIFIIGPLPIHLLLFWSPDTKRELSLSCISDNCAMCPLSSKIDKIEFWVKEVIFMW